jgi:hypothetical protein
VLRRKVQVLDQLVPEQVTKLVKLASLASSNS